MSRMTYMRSWKNHRLTSHTLGLNPQIGRPLSRIVGAIDLFYFFIVFGQLMDYLSLRWNQKFYGMAN
jgi:hypothetical protein